MPEEKKDQNKSTKHKKLGAEPYVPPMQRNNNVAADTTEKEPKSYPVPDDKMKNKTVRRSLPSTSTEKAAVIRGKGKHTPLTFNITTMNTIESKNSSKHQRITDCCDEDEVAEEKAISVNEASTSFQPSALTGNRIRSLQMNVTDKATSAKVSQNGQEAAQYGKPRKYMHRSGVGSALTDSDYLEIHQFNTRFIDSHCHMDLMYNKAGRSSNIPVCLQEDDVVMMESLRELYATAFPSNFFGCIPNFIDPDLFRSGKNCMDWMQLQVSSPYVIGAGYGFHPNHVESVEEESWHVLNHILSPEGQADFKVVAIGECGIDLKKSPKTLETQKCVFARLCCLANMTGLPLIVHCRGDVEAEEICLEIMSKTLDINHPIHRHCYMENWEIAKLWMQSFPNVVFGFTPGISMHRTGSPCYEVLLKLPSYRIVLETDAPFFKPAGWDVEPSFGVPGFASTVAHILAKIRSCDPEFLLEMAYQNTLRIYRIQRAVEYDDFRNKPFVPARIPDVAEQTV